VCDLIELNRSFASLALAVTRELNNQEIMCKWRCFALGHPLGCTGQNYQYNCLMKNETQREANTDCKESSIVGTGQGSISVYSCYRTE
jgi:acetyl-CoA acetyltransferase